MIPLEYFFFTEFEIAGPTSALTFFVLGLTVTAPKGLAWSVAPHIDGGLPAAEGGFSTALGWFGVKWKLSTSTREGKKTHVFTLKITTPKGTNGTFVLPPMQGNVSSITIDGKKLSASTASGDVAVDGGTRNIVVVAS